MKSFALSMFCLLLSVVATGCGKESPGDTGKESGTNAAKQKIVGQWDVSVAVNQKQYDDYKARTKKKSSLVVQMYSKVRYEFDIKSDGTYSAVFHGAGRKRNLSGTWKVVEENGETAKLSISMGPEGAPEQTVTVNFAEDGFTMPLIGAKQEFADLLTMNFRAKK